MRTIEPLSPEDLRAGRNRALRLVIGLLTLVLVAVPTYRWSEYRGEQAAREDANHRLELFSAAVDGVVKRLEHIPSTVELNPDVAALLRTPNLPGAADKVNRYLQELNRQVGAIAVYVLDDRGITLAASNWNQPDSYVGEDLSFRTYFRWGVGGLTGRHFAVGTTVGEPGYYVSRPVRDGNRVIGVTVIKISLAGLDEAWASLAVPALIADHNGVVIMSPVREWLYTALEPLGPEALLDARASRLYHDQVIRPFPVPIARHTGDFDTIVELARPPRLAGAARGRGAATYMVVGRPLVHTGWWLMLFLDLKAVRSQALSHAALAATASGLMIMLMVFVAQRRRIVRNKLEAQALLEQANVALEATVAARTSDLSTTNARLREEISERKNAERTLRAAQDELVQAAKLAVLGQLATGITHELAQPLGAIRTLSGNAAEFLRRGSVDTTEKNLAIISRLADQMGAIISPLKTFARKSPAVPARVDVAHAVGNALLLLDQKLQRNGITVRNRVAPDTVIAWCDQIRLEQVLVNLIGNAADAMTGQAQRSLEVTASAPSDGPVELCVTDTGPGLPPDVQARLFEPFFTTKPAGEGLGLGLAISRDIVREFGGELAASSAPGGGACFRITLPARQPEISP